MTTKHYKNEPKAGRELTHLLREKRELSVRLKKVDARISRMKTGKSAPVPTAKLDHWLNDLTKGLPDLPPLPKDFSRADIYDEHD
jgi:hypothetical protein